jgi:hypothetical protein
MGQQVPATSTVLQRDPTVDTSSVMVTGKPGDGEPVASVVEVAAKEAGTEK